MSNVFEIAARGKFRYDSPKGALTTEQLFDLPLSSEKGTDLDSIARAISKQLREMTEESFVQPRSNPAKSILAAKLEVLKAVIERKQTENAEAVARRDREAQRQRILDALDTARGNALSSKSVEELEDELKRLNTTA
jgi:hypothetical protein